MIEENLGEDVLDLSQRNKCSTAGIRRVNVLYLIRENVRYPRIHRGELPNSSDYTSACLAALQTFNKSMRIYLRDNIQ